ncbi:unnamed protein product, partial [Meganyctiphanes norvegica]
KIVNNKKDQQKIPAQRKHGPIFPLEENKRYLTQLQTFQSVSSSQKRVVMRITWNANSHSSYPHPILMQEHLEPYKKGGITCYIHKTCLACLTDQACGWCPSSNSCLDRASISHICPPYPTLNPPLDTKSQTVAGVNNFLTLVPEQCVTCEQHIYCTDCVSSGECEWLPEEAYCSRHGRFPGAVWESGKCPAPCHKRKTCTSCLGDPGRCAWCQESKECFLFSVYTSVYQYGSCRVWLDEDHTNVTSTQSSKSSQPAEIETTKGTTLPYLSTDAGQSQATRLSVEASECQVCESQTTCKSCLGWLGCGWCYNIFNPTIGICTAGDFSHPSKGKCMDLLSEVVMSAMENVSRASELSGSGSGWAYATCPDVDECLLGLHDCHPNATCTNTPGNFNCTCNRGFKGNGHNTCERTCYDECIHGYCSGGPDYTCKCDLGWMGHDCSINCGCNNHSTCKNGIGKCDSCQDWTNGTFCELCKPGSYGNATTVGCKMCDCNNHWDDTLGRCNQETGQCFCVHNTYGHHCHKCKPGNSWSYYFLYFSILILWGSLNGEIFPYKNCALEVHSACMWIITPYSVLEPPPPQHEGLYPIQVEVTDMNIDCSEGVLYIYDGVPSFVSTSIAWGRYNHILGSLCQDQAVYPLTLQATSGFMTIFYDKQQPQQGFNASYEILRCPDQVGENRICFNNRPTCKDGWRGKQCDIEICPNKCSEKEDRGHCDLKYGRCKCNSGFVGEDCGIILKPHHVVVTELFSPAKIGGSLSHLTTVLPRMGHSLVLDHHGSLWMFAGYSLSRGPLNDIQQFDTINNTWKQVTVNVQPGSQPPPHRYFHAAAYVSSHREMFVYGGMNKKSFLKDFWKFNIDSGSWTLLNKDATSSTDVPPRLAGHTLTYRKDAESQSLVLIGGASTEYGFLECVWEYKLRNGYWHKLNTTGTIPVGIYGHSTVYHHLTKTFYVYGGYSFKIDKVNHFPDLYALDYESMKWSVLPPDRKINHNPASLPAPRIFHTAVTTEDYMVVVGGHIVDHRGTNQHILLYSYKCNMWIPINNHFITLVGHDIDPHIGTSAAIKDSNIYIFGGYSGTLKGSMVEIQIPSDLCTLNANKSQCQDRIGCANCVVYDDSGTNTSYCYSNTHQEPPECLSPTSRKTQVLGTMCDAALLQNRDCYQHTTCTECLAHWPAQPKSQQPCQWCYNCPKGKCIPKDGNCTNENSCEKWKNNSSIEDLFVTEAGECPERSCVASDCSKCEHAGNCIWTRQVLRSSETGYTFHLTPIYNWLCVNINIKNHSYVVETSPPSKCPVGCHHYKSCETCLSSPGAEGGWQHCQWSSTLGECISPSYIALRCLGGTCGRVLSGGASKCPRPCEDLHQCSLCLSDPRCGWCALDTQLSGVGICTQGTLTEPKNSTCQDRDYTASIGNASLVAMHRLRHSVHLLADDKSWHYETCPPENECINGHHTCDPQSQVCVDMPQGYKCDCAHGFNMTEEGVCVPVCAQGCVHGSCIQPNNCSCNFGYVGKNCSIQCQCNGHSNCAGPDQLDICLECHNNTMGNQCQKCKPLFVGDPSNNGKCESCYEYCNTHAQFCYDANLLNSSNLTNSWELRVMDIPQFQLTEGARSNAVCVECTNHTTGPRCDDCLQGYSRISTDMRVPCKPCNCNGHGNMCDPVWGTDCNCGNNTDTPQCGTKSRQVPDKEEDKDCWQHQCSKCKEQYIGNPSNGHQCYRQMSVDKEFCLDPYTQNNCETNPSSLEQGQTVFFAIQPKFMNVDIRLVLDVTSGGSDVYFSSREDTFVVTLNETTGQHQVKIDESLAIAAEPPPALYHTKPLNRNYLGKGLDFLDIGGLTSLPPKEKITHNKTQRTIKEYHIIEKTADGLKYFVTVSRSNDIVIVKNVTNRLVITLPQHQHDLRSAKFYIVVYGIGNVNEPQTLGSIFFRQDQPRIDLFVFFSVFFSCFFLFLAICVVVWKIKQGVDVRRARRRHVVEMLHMAKRPFATCTLVLHGEEEATLEPWERVEDPPPWSPARRKPRHTKKDRSVDGMDVGPLAVEPTDDGVAAVVTVMVQLPGGGIGSSVGQGPTHRLALGSSLSLMSRIYPPASRPFHLRRRTSHMAA